MKVWKDGAKLYGKLNIAEPVKDMVVHNHMVFTVKDLDLVITDVKVASKLITVFLIPEIVLLFYYFYNCKFYHISLRPRGLFRNYEEEKLLTNLWIFVVI